MIIIKNCVVIKRRTVLFLFDSKKEINSFFKCCGITITRNYHTGIDSIIGNCSVAA